MGVAASTVSGPVSAVPCAHCGKPQDYTALENQRDEEGLAPELPRGARVECDDCGKLSEVVDVRKVVLVRQA
jgi:endogenous inhibitor of DNA gyrase (YacG/DUF329 family)